MLKPEQGTLLKVSGITWPVLVVSNTFFNQSGKVVICPVLQKAEPGPLHIPLQDCPVEGIVLCEQVRYLDLSVRRVSVLTQISYYNLMDISDALMGIFDYQAL